jgi:preprotein translocase subunit SecG
MSETLIFVIIFAVIMFFMHRGQGAHGGGGMGGCGGHSHGSHKGRGQREDE